MLAPETCFYLNFKVFNAAEAFPKIMRGKLRADGKGKGAISLASKGSQLVAQQRQFGAVFSNVVAEKLIKTLRNKLEESGIQIEMTQVHCAALGFVVLRAQVVEVDLMKLLEKARGSEFADKLRPLVGIARKLTDVDRRVVPTIQTHMMLKLEKDVPAMLKERLALDMMVVTRPSSEQADFMFGALSPHEAEIEIETLPAAEDFAPRTAQSWQESPKSESRFGARRLLHRAASAVVPRRVSGAPDRVCSKLQARRLSKMLRACMVDAGVTVAVVKRSAGTSGRSVLRCEVTDVDLGAFRPAAEAAGIWTQAGLAHDQHYLKLGHKGREETHAMIRKYISVRFPKKLVEERELHARVEVRDVQRSSSPSRMQIDLSDSESDTDATQTTRTTGSDLERYASLSS